MQKLTREVLAARFGCMADASRYFKKSPQLIQYWVRAGFYITDDNKIVKLIGEAE
jgi:hypothetical protein